MSVNSLSGSVQARKRQVKSASASPTHTHPVHRSKAKAGGLSFHPAPRLADNELSEKEKAIVRMVNE